MISLSYIQGLYDNNRFLDAYRESSQYWKVSTPIQQLSTEELILGGRLAFRLGGHRLSRRLFREADAKDHDNPRVIYFARQARRSRTRLLDNLYEFESNQDACAADPEIQAAWLASHAVTWAFFRDFSRAHECLARANILRTRDAWVTNCEADVLGLEDRWSEALERAEVAWEINPGTPHAAGSLSKSLLNLGRVEESSRRLVAAAESCQSYEIVHLACWHQCAWAETLEGDERRRALAVARELADRLPGLTPLADRLLRQLVFRIRIDIAELADDHTEMELWAKEVRIPFYRKVLENLRKNPGGLRVRLPFPRSMQKHQACLPTSLASALGTLGDRLDPDAMASEITFGGTQEWAAAEWLEKRGFAVRFFTVNPVTAALLIKHGIGFVFTLEGDDGAHAVAAVGLDEAAGTLIVHDPMSYRTVEYLLEGLGGKLGPFGIRGMVAVPQVKSALLDQILPENDVAVMTALQMYQKAAARQGANAARKIVEDISQKLPSHPGTRALVAMQAAEDGRAGEALLGYQQLLREFPKSPFLRLGLIGACRSRRITSLMREALEGVVERGILPGVQSQQEWRFPPARYVSEYADLLRFSSATRTYAALLLHHALRREPKSAEAWHVLGNLEYKETAPQRALLCFRIASCLAPDNDHFCFAYAGALARSHREEEGSAWLERRVRELGSAPRGIGTWISWIRFLEEWGHPERAVEACTEGLAKHGQSPPLLAFTVPFLARMGCWDEAERYLGVLQATGNPSLSREAGAAFHCLSGDLPLAVENTEAWVRESPRSMAARYALVDLIAKRDGGRRALELAARWLRDNPDHDEFQQLYYRQLDRAAEPKGRKYSLLLRRLKRDREDAWAWREVAFCCIEDYELANDRRRTRLLPRIQAWLRECDRTGAEDVATVRIHARWLQACARWKEAADLWLDAVEREPGNTYAYERAWECSSGFSSSERREVWHKIEIFARNSPGRLEIAQTVMPRVASRFGVAMAEEALVCWRAERPDDPELAKAYADLLLDHGRGRTDAERVYELLKTAIRHFPHHLGLRFSLVKACRKLGRVAEAEDSLREIVRRHPHNSAARIQLAWIHELRGEFNDACQFLEKAAINDPQNREVSNALVQILIRHRDIERAKAMVRDLLERAPRDVNWRHRAIRLLVDCGDHDGAVEAARTGVKVYPRAAYMWFLLGNTLGQFRRYAQPGEIESCLQRSMELSPAFLEAADDLAIFLTEQRRYQDAEQVMLRIKEKLYDPSAAQGRLAWIHRQQGLTSEAREEMAATVLQYPWYQWGWNVLMEWLIADQSWEQARTLLATVPDEQRTVPQFRRQRIVLLEKSGLPVKEVDAEWSQLTSRLSAGTSPPPHPIRSPAGCKAALRRTSCSPCRQPLGP